MLSGKFIVFEGGDGAGKDTQIAMLQKVVDPAGYLFVRDPGSTDIGLALRAILLHDKRVTPRAELLMYLAARVQLVEEKIKPALKEGKTVVSNRFDLSTIAYQIYGRERMELLPFLMELSRYALGGISPDVVIFLDVPPEIGLKRAAQVGAPDRMEEEKLAFHERVRRGYQEHIGDYKNQHTIDATTDVAEVHKEVLKALKVDSLLH